MLAVELLDHPPRIVLVADVDDDVARQLVSMTGQQVIRIDEVHSNRAEEVRRLEVHALEEPRGDLRGRHDDATFEGGVGHRENFLLAGEQLERLQRGWAFSAR
jgi:hypothetical protein